MRKRLVPYLKGGALTAAIVLLLPFVTPRRADGVIPVIDSGSYLMLGHIWSQDISNYQKMIETFNQLVKIYTSGVQLYNLGYAMSRSFTGPQKGQWMTIAQLATDDLTKDKYGETITWPMMVNGHPSLAPRAWATATYGMQHDSYMSGQTPGNSAALAHLATINAIDGASVKCLQTVSNYNLNAGLNLPALIKLGVAHLDGTSATNSQIQQLNLINAHAQQSGNEQRAQGQVNACLAQQITLQNKLQRDQLAQHLDYVGQVHDLNQSADLNWGGGTAATLASYRP